MTSDLIENEPEAMTVIELINRLEELPSDYTVHINVLGKVVCGITGAEDIGGDYFSQVFLANFDHDPDVNTEWKHQAEAVGERDIKILIRKALDMGCSEISRVNYVFDAIRPHLTKAQPSNDVLVRVADAVHRVAKYKCDEIQARYIAKAALAQKDE